MGGARRGSGVRRFFVLRKIYVQSIVRQGYRYTCMVYLGGEVGPWAVVAVGLFERHERPIQPEELPQGVII